MTQQWNPLEVGAAMPDSIGRCADLYKAVRDLRLQMEKETETIKARETEIKDHIINNLAKSRDAGGDTGAAGLKYRAQVITTRKPKISDWGVLCSWIRKNDRFDMLQKRLGENAVMDWNGDPQNEGKQVPGTEIINIPDVSITKI